MKGLLRIGRMNGEGKKLFEMKKSRSYSNYFIFEHTLLLGREGVRRIFRRPARSIGLGHHNRRLKFWGVS